MVSTRVLHLSTNDIAGGAARAAYRLHEGLRGLGHPSQMLVVSRTSDDPSVVTASRQMGLGARMSRGLRQYRIAREFSAYRGSRPTHCELFSDDRTEYRAAIAQHIPSSDVVNLHWVAGFVDYQSFFQAVPRVRPVVWTLHDMNPFTGGCHYNLACDRYLNECGSCPQLGSAAVDDLSHKIWMRKQAILSQVDSSRLHIIAPSSWLAHAARDSVLLGRFRVSVIPYGLDVESTFVPHDKKLVRSLLGIPHSARVVLFIAESANAPRKGFTLLIEALERAAQANPEVYLLSLGRGKPEITSPIRWLHLGSLDNDKFISMVYSAADVFVICSVQDNLPNTVLEAMACGVAVVGVDVGGIPDMVRNGVNGLVVRSGDAAAVAKAVTLILNDENMRHSMSTASRRIAREEYSSELQAKRYAELYAAATHR